uniref:Putative secreted protein n=1 Tax=Anopheles darlingi TaxID=43151 RepID=A0A2M4DFS0_ANODA
MTVHWFWRMHQTPHAILCCCFLASSHNDGAGNNFAFREDLRSPLSRDNVLTSHIPPKMLHTVPLNLAPSSAFVLEIEIFLVPFLATLLAAATFHETVILPHIDRPCFYNGCFENVLRTALLLSLYHPCQADLLVQKTVLGCSPIHLV